MPIPSGTKLGPYEILAPIGAGGMGEVYRARDERLKREIAIKVLPSELAADPERRSRFEREARSASALSHPNILSIYDIGSVDHTVYIAMELVDGATLKDLTASGALPVKKMLDISVQIADGLAAAHAAGIVHRDLKPQNVMVSKHGFVKILDFGLAKLVTPEEQEVSGMRTAVGDPTRPGMVMGTVGYMSPEQAAGRAVDYRSDQFSFGSIIYELATGKRAFERNTTAETMTAIIREEPPPLAQLNPKVPSPVRWLVERCLAKDPEDRFGTTKDLARDLADVRDHLSETSIASTTDNTAAAAAAVRAGRAKWAWPLVALAVLAAGATAGLFAGRRVWHVDPPSFKQLTFRRGVITSARFAPDGQTVYYSASWEGNPLEIFISRPESPESRPFGLPGAEVLAMSHTGELALSLNRRAVDPFIRAGTLARLSMAGGGSPREVLDDVFWADWSPDGKQLAIVREVGGAQQLEYPIGKVLHRTAGWLESVHVSPGGDLVAFLDHPARGDDGGTVAVVDAAGKKRTLTEPFASGHGLAWSRSGDEVWYTAAKVGGNRALYAAGLHGGERTLYRITGNLTLQDVARDGRVLVTQDVERLGNLGRGPGQEKEVELTWLDWALANDLTPDGKTLLFTESGEGGGPGYSAYTRSTDGAPAVRLGEGSAQALSPDGKWAVGVLGISSEPRIFIYPIGAGDPRTLAHEGIDVQSAAWMPDGKRFVLTASEPGRGPRIFLRALDGKPRAISPEGYRAFGRAVSPDGRRVVARGPDQRWYLYPLEGGEPTPVPGLDSADQPSGWTTDGQSLWVFRRAELPARVSRLDIATGKRELWKELLPADASGVTEVTSPLPTPDGKYYVYTYIRRLSDLYVAEGLK